MSALRRGLDTNVLVYAHLPAFEEHPQIRAFLLEELRNPAVTLVITPTVLHEFVHVVTDLRRFESPLEMTEALALARLYLGKSNVTCLSPDEAILLEAYELLERHRLGRKRIADTVFAATLLHHGTHEIITCNGSDFKIFEGLRVVDPLRS